ncbi:ubiquitin-like-conjugating enzyme ATG10 [Topomyia yanbarensis]|uniref:ubiquitin-like-conjugating enzyme ATG10 n=1 Tax=Topomyia yanbarensis TaxID=2498891 RepID=UPI00273AEC4F|nr:ubiquitin-like-conjugating enzyme ATG10 [Topomyia yanbarensis]
MIGTLTEEEFVIEAQQFLNLSQQLHDGWELVKSKSGTVYLKKQLMQPLVLLKNVNLEEDNQDELLVDDPSYSTQTSISELYRFDYHVIYSISYQVPVLYFNVYKSDGTVLSLEEAWSGFLALESSEQLHQTLTQMEHPVLFRPFLALHPCQTAQVLGNTSKSKNRIVSFISSYGPVVNLNLSLDYAALVD